MSLNGIALQRQPMATLTRVVLIVCMTFACTSAFSGVAADDEAVYAALAGSRRLSDIQRQCDLASFVPGLRTTPELIQDQENERDCLVGAAILEFTQNFESIAFTATEFETRLRAQIAEEASLVVSINTQHGRCAPCGTMWGPIRAGYEEGAASDYLQDIWDYYRYRSLR